MVHVLKNVQNLLGTFVTITVVHPDANEGIRALSAAFGEIRRIQDLMSAEDPGSEVGVLNREGRYEGMSKDTEYVIQRANEFSELSKGVFDITVLPVLELWKEKARDSQIPGEKDIRSRLKLVNYEEVVVENRSIRFGKPGMRITLAGVAKGYAVDKAIEALREAHIKHGLVNAGGDIRALGGKTENLPWRVAIRDPIHKTKIVTTIDLRDQAIATSGTYQRVFNDTIHPRAGKPVHGLLSSTVLANTAIDADILATCMLVAGTERGCELLERSGGKRAWVVKDDGTIWN